MKKGKLLMVMAILLCCSTTCVKNGKVVPPISMGESDKTFIAMVEQNPEFYAALNGYLADSIGSHYAPGELCIPCPTVVASTKQDDGSHRVLGDFWVFNYNVVGDTLKTVSGGSHPGAMILKKTDTGYVVTSFEQVEDGSNFLPSAKRIFGDMYMAFHGINSDEETREQARALFIAKYVKDNKLPVKYYQDYGWPAKRIPVE